MNKTIKVINSDLEISKIGFGCARLSGGVEIKQSFKILQSAYESGIRHFDTAPMYQTEEILGNFFQGIRDVTFCSKVGIDPVFKSQDGGLLRFFYKKSFKHVLSHFPDLKQKLLAVSGAYKPFIVKQEFKHAKVLTRDYVLRRLEDSLKKIRRPILDIYLVHEPDLFLLGPDLLEIFEELKSKGFIKSYGLGYSRPMLNSDIEFGSIVQSGWVPHLGNNSISHTNIFHGVLRNGKSEDFYKLIRSSSDAAVIFSASTVGQIKRLMNGLRNINE
jgi:D-threo-aldose 1-dehydrogenase